MGQHMFNKPKRRSLGALYLAPVSVLGLVDGQVLAQQGGAGRFCQV